MKLNKKGFTLIELLAVIVILAIIALIVTPVISNIISKAKQATNARSVEGHVKDIQIAIMSAAFDEGLNLSVYNQVSGELNATLAAAVNSSTRVVCTSYQIADGTVKNATGCTVDGAGTYEYHEATGAKVTA